MKLWLLALLLLAVLLSAAWADQQQPRSRREVKTSQETKKADDNEDNEEEKEAVEKNEEENDEDEDDEEYSEDEVDVVKEEKKQEEEEEKQIEKQEEEKEQDEEDEKQEEEEEKEEERRNPCLDKECRRGEVCSVDKKQRARCVCIAQCREPETGDRYQVCSNQNVTYPSECALDRDHCLCRRQMEGCSSSNSAKIRLDYYGPCQELTPCSEREFELFPGRMREWLFVIMQQMAQRAKIPEYVALLEEARGDGNHSHAVIWKFCDLDVDPHDRFVTRSELMFTIQSLKALEHCLVPFLDHCDTDNDGRITLWEWGRCLGLEEEKIRDECKNVSKAAGRAVVEK